MSCFLECLREIAPLKTVTTAWLNKDQTLSDRTRDWNIPLKNSSSACFLDGNGMEWEFVQMVNLQTEMESFRVAEEVWWLFGVATSAMDSFCCIDEIEHMIAATCADLDEDARCERTVEVALIRVNKVPHRCLLERALPELALFFFQSIWFSESPSDALFGLGCWRLIFRQFYTQASSWHKSLLRQSCDLRRHDKSSHSPFWLAMDSFSGKINWWALRKSKYQALTRSIFQMAKEIRWNGKSCSVRIPFRKDDHET